MDCNGRFSLTKSPQALPGNCGGCGRATDNLGFIDTGLQFEYHGALIFCSECVLDMASKFGYVNIATADGLKARVDELEHNNITLRAAIVGLENALDGLQTARANLSGLVDNNEHLIIPEPPKETPAEEQPSSVVETAESIAATGNSEIDGSSSEQESLRIPSDSGYVNLDELQF